MRIIRNFRCPDCDKLVEEYISNEVESIECECGGIAVKEVSFPQYFKMGGFRTSIDTEAWAKDRTRRNKKIANNEGL